MAGCPSCRQPNNKYLEMRLGASVAFAFNSLAQGPVTRGYSWRRRDSNPAPQDSRPDALATQPYALRSISCNDNFEFKLPFHCFEKRKYK